MPLYTNYAFEYQKNPKVRKNSQEEQKIFKIMNLKLTSNITFLVKKYVKFMFKSFQVDIQTGKLNL